MSSMSFSDALEALDAPVSCAGVLRLEEPLVVGIAGSEVAAHGSPLVEWVVPRSEPAPFGHGRETKLDPAVRQALRLRARGAVEVRGLDLSVILAEVERRLSPRQHLAATLTDVTTYLPGGHFARHKDTPRSPDLVGTLIIALPVPHEGGALRVDDEVGSFDWGRPTDPRVLRWVALFTDVDHAVEPVTSGARVTLTYALTRTDRMRADETWSARMGALLQAARMLELADSRPLMIACARQVITTDGVPLEGLSALRGTDRDVAEALTSCGFSVVVRTCLAARYRDADAFTELAPVPRLRGEGISSGTTRPRRTSTSSPRWR